MTIEMLPALSPAEVAANRAAWVTALLSGEYAQADGRLHVGDGYCCLGVAENVRGASWTRRNDEPEYDVADCSLTLLDPVTGEPLVHPDYPATERRLTLGSGDNRQLTLLSGYAQRWLGLYLADPYVVVWQEDEDNDGLEPGWITTTLTELNDSRHFTLPQIGLVIRDQAPDWDGRTSSVGREADRRREENLTGVDFHASTPSPDPS